MSIKPEDKEMMLGAIELMEKNGISTGDLKVKIIEMPEKKSCLSCEYWNHKCARYNAVPPEHVQNNGCAGWKFHGVPF